MINSTFGYNDFSTMYLGINDIKLTVEPGIDGVTNTFASAIWAIDIYLEFNLMTGWEIDFNHKIFAGNFQSILGPAPDFKPSPIYYGLIFASIIRDGTPAVIIPAQQAHLSSRIKVYGLSTGDIFKVLLINKDMNKTLSGVVNVQTDLTGIMKCVNL